MTDRFTPGDACEYDGTLLPVTRDGRGDACPTCRAALDKPDSVEGTLDEVPNDQTS